MLSLVLSYVIMALCLTPIACCSLLRRYYFALATLLDPRFKQRVFSSTSSGAYVRQMLILSYETLDSQENSNPPSPKRLREESEEAGLLPFSGGSVMSRLMRNPSLRVPLNRHSLWLTTTLKSPISPGSPVPFSYWIDRLSSWPILASLAKRYLCAPPATVASERLFSTAVNVCTDSRNCLPK